MFFDISQCDSKCQHHFYRQAILEWQVYTINYEYTYVSNLKAMYTCLAASLQTLSVPPYMRDDVLFLLLERIVQRVCYNHYHTVNLCSHVTQCLKLQSIRSISVLTSFTEMLILLFYDIAVSSTDRQTSTTKVLAML